MIQTIGLEIHAELLTRTKIFCACPNAFGSDPNTNICPICIGQPGTLPQLNQKAVELSVRAGLATHCVIHEISGFDRKNYMYPDLPKAYQITQFYRPIATDGYLEVKGKRIRIREIHLEEDAGKLLYAPNGEIWVDYNRCGVPLIEVVTQPDMESAEEAEAFARELLLILKDTGVCDGHMELGSFRMDVNLSLRENAEDPLGERVEIKNLNSFRSLRSAITYEAERQEMLLNSGHAVERETRRFSQESGETLLMRSKESLEDYRYFPDPDMPDIVLDPQDIDATRACLPELPEQKRTRWSDKLSTEQIEILLNRSRLGEYFDELCRHTSDTSLGASVLLREGLRCCRDIEEEDFIRRLPPERFAGVVNLVSAEKIMRSSCEALMLRLLECEEDPSDAANAMGLVLQYDDDALDAIIDQVLRDNPDSVIAYREGKTKTEKFLIGQVMRIAGKGTDPRIAARKLHEKLK